MDTNTDYSVELATFRHPDDDVYDQDRPLALHRPCGCGCDQRDNPNLVGYLNAITNGVGFTLRVFDEDTYSVLEEVLS